MTCTNYPFSISHIFRRLETQSFDKMAKTIGLRCRVVGTKRPSACPILPPSLSKRTMLNKMASSMGDAPYCRMNAASGQSTLFPDIRSADAPTTVPNNNCLRSDNFRHLLCHVGSIEICHCHTHRTRHTRSAGSQHICHIRSPDKINGLVSFLHFIFVVVCRTIPIFIFKIVKSNSAIY